MRYRPIENGILAELREKIKIIRIIGRLNIGGPARNAVLLTEGLTGGDCWDTVLACGEVDKTEGDMMYLAKEKSLNPIIIKELGRKISWKDDLAALWKIYRILCREKPDIAHTHTAKAGTLGRIAGILYNLGGSNRRVLLVHTFHGHVLSGYFGNIKTAIFLSIERILSVFTDRIVTQSRSLKKELVEKFKVASENKISVVRLGFELDGLLKIPERGYNGYINIGIVGRLVPIKNHRMFIDIAKELKDKNSDSKIKFLIVGDGELRNDLENYAKNLGLSMDVVFLGWRKDLENIYADLDIVCLTSLNEGTPVSLIEAMAAAKPVIATDVGGTRDIVEHGKSGLLLQSQDRSGFVKSISMLLNDSARRREMGSYGREFVIRNFRKERLIKDMECLYKELLNEKGLI